jgi:hypothetical protein
LSEEQGLMLYLKNIFQPSSKMPWSFALPQEFFTSPVLAVATPISVGSLVGYLVNSMRASSSSAIDKISPVIFMADQLADTYSIHLQN